jgi:hypothetical protein
MWYQIIWNKVIGVMMPWLSSWIKAKIDTSHPLVFQEYYGKKVKIGSVFSDKVRNGILRNAKLINASTSVYQFTIVENGTKTTITDYVTFVQEIE